MPEFSRNLAFVIGINDYQNGIPPLQNAVNDAKKLVEILREQHGYQMWVCLDEDATLKNLHELLEKTLPQQVTSDDRLLFYFAGHGIALNSDDGPEGYLILQDAKLGDTKTYLPMTKLQESLNNLQCRHFLGILDCCFAGAFRWSSTRDLLTTPEVIHQERYDRFICDPAWQVITSAAYDQKAADAFALITERGEIGNHSPFAAALLSALTGGADIYPPAANGKQAGDGVITATELYLYLRDRVELATFGRQRQTPGIWPLKKHDKGEYIFLTPGHQLNLPPAPPLDESQNPYRGLQSFEEQHSRLFFGRQALTEQLYQRICQQPLTVVLGASGTGKSSLVKAGLIPLLKQSQQEWRILAPIRPGEFPFTALNNTLIKENLPGFDKPAEVFEQELQRLAQSVKAWSEANPSAKLLLVSDQFEELVTLCRNDDERSKFLSGLARAIAAFPKQLRIVLTLRSDFEPQFRDTPLEQYWTAARFVVPAMTREELRQAIVEPATYRVMYFEPPTIVDQLIDEVAQMPGALPLLSFTLSELYFKYIKSAREGKTNNRAMTQVDYEQLGGVTRSLTQRADCEYDQLVKLDPAVAQTIKHLMLRMVAVGGGELARRRVFMTELEYPEPENSRVKSVIESFAAARLLVRGQDTEGNVYIEPAHDALVRGWQKLLIWKKQEQENLVLQRRLTPAALEWKSKQQTKYLWNADPRLDLLKQVLNSSDNWLNKIEAEFVHSSVREKRKNSILRWNLVTATFLLLSSATVTAINYAINAQNKSLETSSALADSMFVSGKELDALLQATKTGEMLKNMEKTLFIREFFVSQDTKIRVLTTLQKVVYGIREHNYWKAHNNDVLSVSFSPDGKIIASAGRDGTVKLWQRNGELIQTLLHAHDDAVFNVSFTSDSQILISGSQQQAIKIWQRHPDDHFTFRQSIRDEEGSHGIIALALSPDDQTIATASIDDRNTIKLWSLDGKRLRTFLGHSDRVNGLSFSPDGQTIASGSADHIIKLWSLKDGTLRKTIRENNDVYGVLFVNSKTIVSASADGTVKLWNVNSRLVWESQGRHRQPVERLALSRDGKTIASASSDDTVILWNLKDGKLLHTFTGYNDDVSDVSFSADSKMMASASKDGTVRIWNLNNVVSTVKGSSLYYSPDSKMIVTGENNTIKLWQQDGKLLKTFGGHDQPINRVSWSLDGKTIASASADKTVKLWDLHGKLLVSLLGHKGSVTGISFRPNSNMIASASTDKTVKLWDLDGRLLATFDVGSIVTSVSFSPDGNMIASSDHDQTVKLWRLDGTHVTFKGHIAPVLDVSFSPKGNIIASASDDGTVKLWRLNGKCIKKLSGLQNPVNRVNFSPNGQTLALASEDRTIKLWNLNTELLHNLGRHNISVVDISFSPDNKTVASADNNKEVILWNLDLDNLLQRSCSRIHDYLTDRKDSTVELCKRSSSFPF